MLNKKKKIMNIPWAKPYIGENELENIKECFNDNWLTMGKKVQKLEKLLVKKVGADYTLAVNSGTAALDIALKILDIQPGDEVIVPAFTYIATANSVLYQHATPVFADIDKNTFNISPDSVKENISSKTKAIIAIDYAGQGSDYDKLMEIAENNDIYLVEDGAPGLGGKYKEHPLCNMGHISTTSFHMAKLFTTVEGGMVFMNNKKWLEKGKIIRSQGESPNKKYYHPFLGHNYRMTDLAASIGLAQLERYNSVIEKREKLAEKYNIRLKGMSDLTIPEVLSHNKHAWFLYPILVNNRNKIVTYLDSVGIQTNISYPYPVYEQPIYKKYFKNRCKNAEKVSSEVLCLPMYYEMTDKEQDYVIEHIHKVLGKK